MAIPSWVGVLMALAVLAPGQSASADGQAPVGAEDAKLKQLFHDSNEAELKRNPLEAIQRGDLRYADRFGEPFTEAEWQADAAADRADLAALARIDRSKLNAIDQLAYDVFRDRTERDLRGYAPAVLGFETVMPLNHMGGLQVWYPRFASGEEEAPFKTVLDYENNLKRNAGYAAALDRAIGRYREGLAKGVTQPKLVVQNMIGEFDALIADGVEGSDFYGPVKMFPVSIPAAEKTRLTAAYARQVREVIQPAHQRVRDFLATTYLPAARDTIGLAALPGGRAYYAYRIENQTTLQLDPEAAHQLGQDELARDTAELERLKTATGFTGTLAQFFEFLRTDKRFQPTSGDQVRAAYAEIARRVDLRVREQFSLIPKTPIELRPVPPAIEKGAAPGSYHAGTPDGSRPGLFTYNTYNLPSRSTWTMEDLYLHEGVPGHHFQISLAQENTALPDFMRFGGDAAYVEGWGLYAEGLGSDLGMGADPYARIGVLYGDMVRAVRLVVDTGIHAKGWTREQAIEFELSHVPISRTAATAEVERYVARPGQGLAYKIGQLTILQLKTKAKAALGARFDPRAFHAAVLDSGALPLPILERKIDAWISAQDVRRRAEAVRANQAERQFSGATPTSGPGRAASQPMNPVS